MYKLSGIGWIILLIVALIGCGSEKPTNDETAGAAAVETGDNGGTANTDGTAGNSDTPNQIGGPVCGNKTKEAGEDCDDGNKDTATCKGTCEFWCTKNSDCEKTECAGASSTCDMTTHTCAKSASQQANGTTCGDNKNCQEGKCVVIACGNGYKEGSEECDDGNDDDSDGCTTLCKYTCVKGDKARSCKNDCDLYSTECGDDHKCKVGQPEPDGALCKNGGGLCKNGRCVETVCGDGNKTANEECDLGAKNGSSACTKTCTIAVCGDGKISDAEGSKEQCDDGNTKNLDGCDYKCRVELVHRGANMMPIGGAAPAYCHYANKDNLIDKTSDGNRMGKMMANMQSMAGDMTQEQIDQMVAGSDRVFLFQIMDLEDPSLKTEDKIVKVGQGSGMADNTDKPEGGRFTELSQEARLDFPVQVWKEFYDKDLLPLTLSYAEIVKEGDMMVLHTTKPGTLGFRTKEQTYDGGTRPAMDAIIRNVVIHQAIDGLRSKPKSPTNVASWVTLPETSGGFDPDVQAMVASGTNKATGIMCGAFDVKNMANMPLPPPTAVSNMPGLSNITIDATTILCPNPGGKQVKGCVNGEEDLKAGNCNSVLDLLTYGCTGGLVGDLFQPVGSPDVDSDGDGKGDSYTIVMSIAAQRVTFSPNGLRTDEASTTPIQIE